MSRHSQPPVNLRPPCVHLNEHLWRPVYIPHVASRHRALRVFIPVSLHPSGPFPTCVPMPFPLVRCRRNRPGHDSEWKRLNRAKNKKKPPPPREAGRMRERETEREITFDRFARVQSPPPPSRPPFHVYRETAGPVRRLWRARSTAAVATTAACSPSGHPFDYPRALLISNVRR